MEPRPYPLEAVLQELLASDARLLGGASTGEAATRRWILIARESPVRGAGGQSWSADHVFVDDEGVPTVVEVKRGSNTQLRREIVGQLLDYASNLATSTTADDMRQLYEERIRQAGGDPDTELRASLGIETASDEYWALVGENLARGRIRGYFVADVIPEDLRRIVEFLNRQVGESRYVALEVPQFQTADGTTTTFVPQIVAGSLDPPAATSSRQSAAPWSEEQLVASIRDGGPIGGADAALSVLDWAHQRDLDIRGGRGAQYPSLTLSVRRADRPHVARLWAPAGTLELFIGTALRAPLDTDEHRQSIHGRLVAIQGMPWTKGAPPEPRAGTSSVYLGPLMDGGLRTRLLTELDAIVDAYHSVGTDDTSGPVGPGS